jgi:hypothetical protein
MNAPSVSRIRQLWLAALVMGPVTGAGAGPALASPACPTGNQSPDLTVNPCLSTNVRHAGASITISLSVTNNAGRAHRVALTLYPVDPSFNVTADPLGTFRPGAGQTYAFTQAYPVDCPGTPFHETGDWHINLQASDQNGTSSAAVSVRGVATPAPACGPRSWEQARWALPS